MSSATVADTAPPRRQRPPSPPTEWIPALDGLPLGASLFPAAGEPVATVLVVPATGVARRLYDAFARHLAARGLSVVTWDWRGTGDSRPANLRGFEATMAGWARLDLAGVIAWAAAREPRLPLLAVGHSFGGQSLGLAPGAHELAGAVTVASQNGFWGHWPRPRRYALAVLWHLVMPLLAHTLGYFPSRKLGLGEDLPRGVALEWARWCRSPEFLGDWAGHRALAIPLLAIGIDDDTFAPPAAVDALHRNYVAARLERRQLAPAALGLDAIGHFGFFKPGLPAVWDDAAAWLLGVAREAAATDLQRAAPPSH
jgi:predicted alpha/beta hydrolase